MTVHFAAARNSATSPIARALLRRPLAPAANDNGGIHNGLSRNDPLLSAALRHFAEHGLAAAAEARRQAEDAFFAGDREVYNWWLGICRTLDKRMAAKMQRANAHK